MRSRRSETSSRNSAFVVVSAMNVLPILAAECQFRLRDHPAVDRTHRVDDAARRNHLRDGDLQAQLVARHDRMQEPGLRGAEEKDAVLALAVRSRVETRAKQHDGRL